MPSSGSTRRRSRGSRHSWLGERDLLQVRGGREGGKRGREGGREGGREKGKEGEREGQREGGKAGGMMAVLISLSPWQVPHPLRTIETGRPRGRPFDRSMRGRWQS